MKNNALERIFIYIILLFLCSCRAQYGIKQKYVKDTRSIRKESPFESIETQGYNRNTFHYNHYRFFLRKH